MMIKYLSEEESKWQFPVQTVISIAPEIQKHPQTYENIHFKFKAYVEFQP